jgi:peptidyl-prolyl cis-trans isomerase SurA
MQYKHITTTLLILLTGGFASLLSAQNDRALIDKVVATVGGEYVLLSEVQEQYNYAKSQNPALPPDYECVAVQSSIVQKLLVNQAKIDSVDVSEEDVDNQLTARIDRLLGYFNQDQRALEEYYGQSIVDIKEQMRTDMRNQLLGERMQASITEKATVTPSEVQAFFNSIPKDSLPYFNAEVEIREIVYKPQVSQSEKDRARERLEDLRKQISEGASFAELAKRNSDDPGSGEQGGDLGWQKRGTFVQEFEAVAYNLERNQLSEVFESQFGFHIVQLLERRGNLIHTRHILIKPEITTDDLERAKLHLDSIRNFILKDSMPFGFAVKKFGDKDQQSYSNDGRVTNPRSGNTFFEIADLDTDIFFAIDPLKVGDVSEPTPFRTPDGSRLFRLIQLQSRTRPHKADLRLDYNKIQTAALDQKKNGFVEKWVLDRVRSTYLEVDAMYEGCPQVEAMLDEQKTER